MRRELSDLLFIDAIEYKDSMRHDDCLPDGVSIVNFKMGDLPTIETPRGTALLKDGDYILTCINGDNYVCCSHYFYSIKIHNELKEIINKVPEKIYKDVAQDILSHKFVELASVYILNGDVIKVRPGYKGTIAEGILSNNGVYIQINQYHSKTVHIFENEHKIDTITAYIKGCKESVNLDFEPSTVIYLVK